MKKIRNIGITSKLVLILVFFSLIPLSVQVYSLYETVGVLEEKVGVQYQAVAEGLARSLQHYLGERSVDAQTMSRNRILRDRRKTNPGVARKIRAGIFRTSQGGVVRRDPEDDASGDRENPRRNL